MEVSRDRELGDLTSLELSGCDGEFICSFQEEIAVNNTVLSSDSRDAATEDDNECHRAESVMGKELSKDSVQESQQFADLDEDVLNTVRQRLLDIFSDENVRKDPFLHGAMNRIGGWIWLKVVMYGESFNDVSDELVLFVAKGMSDVFQVRGKQIRCLLVYENLLSHTIAKTVLLLDNGVCEKFGEYVVKYCHAYVERSSHTCYYRSSNMRYIPLDVEKMYKLCPTLRTVDFGLIEYEDVDTAMLGLEEIRSNVLLTLRMGEALMLSDYIDENRGMSSGTDSDVEKDYNILVTTKQQKSRWAHASSLEADDKSAACQRTNKTIRNNDMASWRSSGCTNAFGDNNGSRGLRTKEASFSTDQTSSKDTFIKRRRAKTETSDTYGSEKLERGQYNIYARRSLNTNKPCMQLIRDPLGPYKQAVADTAPAAPRLLAASVEGFFSLQHHQDELLVKDILKLAPEIEHPT